MLLKNKYLKGGTNIFRKKEQNEKWYKERINLMMSSSDNNICSIKKNNGKYILIDAGVNSKKIKSLFEKNNINVKDIEQIFYTHKHGDHLHIISLKYLLKENKDLEIYCNYSVMSTLILAGINHDFKIIKDKDMIYLKDITIEVTEVQHGIQTHSFSFWFKDNKEIISLGYATDLKNPNHLNWNNFDIFILEANYCSIKIKSLIEEADRNNHFSHHKKSSKVHCSKQISRSFFELNKHNGSIYIEAHKSKSAYK